MCKRAVIFLFGVVLAYHIKAQEFLGIRNSNYAGIQGAFLNPSSIAGSVIPWDVNALSVGTLFDNNFFFVPKGMVPPLGFRKIIDGITHENLFYTRFDIHQPYKLYNITLSTELVGPSFFLQIKNGQSIGFSMAARGYINNNNVTGHLAQNAFADFKEKDLWNTEWHDQSTQINSMSWFEYGFHYARIISKQRRHEWKAGGSIYYLQGISAAYAKNVNLHYAIIDSANLKVNSSSVDYGITKYDSGKQIPSYRDLNHGSGISGSMGITYYLLKDPGSCGYQSNGEKWNSDDPRDYILRVGISLIDVGSIQFNRNSNAYHYETTGANYPLNADSNSTGLNPALQSVISESDTNRVRTADHFSMSLPSAFSLQVDWQVRKNFYLNATIIRGIDHGGHPGIVRPDQYSLTPRYETKWFEVSIPVSVIYYQRWQPRIGLAFRVGYFFFGGDAPGSLFGLTDFERTDFYAGIHVFPLQIIRKHKGIACPEGVNK